MEEVVQEIEVGPVPYIVHEGELARLERIIKRLWIVLVLTIIFLVASNGAWLWYESQFEEITVSQDVDTGTGAAYIAGVGNVYGTGETDGQGQTP